MTGKSPNRGRSVGIGLLLALGVLLLTVTNPVVWAHYTLLNTEGWVAAVGPLSKEPDIAAVVSLYVVEDPFEGAGLYDAVARELPDGAGHLSGLLVIGLEKFADQEIYRLLIGHGFNDVWKTLNRIGHAAALDVLEGGGQPLSAVASTAGEPTGCRYGFADSKVAAIDSERESGLDR